MAREITDGLINLKKIFNVVRASHKSPSRTAKLRTRTNDVFTVTLSGSSTYELEDGRTIALKRGDVLFLSHTEKYRFSSREPNYEFIFCDFLLEGNAECRSRAFTPRSPERAESLFRRLHRSFNSDSRAASAESASIFYSIYALLLEESAPEYIAVQARHRIEEARQAIDRGFKNSELSISAIAHSVGISEVYLRRLFRAEYGTSPSQYLIAKRLEKARELMRYPFLSLEECALQSGFSSLHYFSRVFKKTFGITAHEYRKKEH